MKNSFFYLEKTTVLVLLGLLSPSFLIFFSSNGYAQMPPPKVEYIIVEAHQIRQWSSFSARISPIESVEVRPLVAGRIEQVLFREGENVTKGQPLFLIDPRRYAAAAKKAEAALATAKSRVRLTSQELLRSQDLMKSKLISQSVFDEALTADEVAQASVLQAESSLLETQINLEYAHINAPISGRVGRAELTLGNIIGAGATASILTTIVSQGKVYAEFNVDERTFIAFNLTSNIESKLPVQLMLSGESTVLHEGYIHAFDNHLDSTTGTIRARAIFNNSDNKLIPGMYVDVRLGTENTKPTLLIPERAIGTNQDRKFIYVIDENNTAQYREIILGQQQKGLRTVLTGLEAGERVIVKGLARIQPNAPVEAVQSESTNDVASVAN